MKTLLDLNFETYHIRRNAFLNSIVFFFLNYIELKAM